MIRCRERVEREGGREGGRAPTCSYTHSLFHGSPSSLHSVGVEFHDHHLGSAADKQPVVVSLHAPHLSTPHRHQPRVSVGDL